MKNYEIWVRCPYCGHVQKTNSFKQKKCVYCNRTFTIFRVRQPSRVVKVEGDYNAYMRDLTEFLRRRKA